MPALRGGADTRHEWIGVVPASPNLGANRSWPTAYPEDISIMRTRRQIARLGSPGPAEWALARDS